MTGKALPRIKESLEPKDYGAPVEPTCTDFANSSLIQRNEGKVKRPDKSGASVQWAYGLFLLPERAGVFQNEAQLAANYAKCQQIGAEQAGIYHKARCFCIQAVP